MSHFPHPWDFISLGCSARCLRLQREQNINTIIFLTVNRKCRAAWQREIQNENCLFFSGEQLVRIMTSDSEQIDIFSSRLINHSSKTWTKSAQQIPLGRARIQKWEEEVLLFFYLLVRLAVKVNFVFFTYRYRYMAIPRTQFYCDIVNAVFKSFVLYKVSRWQQEHQPNHWPNASSIHHILMMEYGVMCSFTVRIRELALTWSQDKVESLSQCDQIKCNPTKQGELLNKRGRRRRDHHRS